MALAAAAAAVEVKFWGAVEWVDTQVKWMTKWGMSKADATGIDKFVKTGASVSGLAGARKAADFFGDIRTALAVLSIPFAVNQVRKSFTDLRSAIASLGNDDPLEVGVGEINNTKLKVKCVNLAQKVLAVMLQVFNTIRWIAFASIMFVFAPLYMVNRQFLEGKNETLKAVGGQFNVFNLAKDAGAFVSSSLEWVLYGICESTDTTKLITRAGNAVTHTEVTVPGASMGAKTREALLDFIERGLEVFNDIAALIKSGVDPLITGIFGVVSSSMGLIRFWVKTPEGM